MVKMFKVAFRTPTAVGLNVIVTGVNAPAATEPVPGDTVKSPAFAPVTAVVNVRAWAPDAAVFRMVRT